MGKNLQLLLSLAAVATILAGCASQSAQPTGTLSGLVVDDRYRPVAGATVAIANLQRTTTTDAQGQYAFDGVPYGTYAVVITYPNGHQTTETKTVP